MIEFFAFAFYPAYPAACDHAYPVPALSLTRMAKTPGIKDHKRPHIDLILGRLCSFIRGDFRAARNAKF